MCAPPGLGRGAEGHKQRGTSRGTEGRKQGGTSRGAEGRKHAVGRGTGCVLCQHPLTLLVLRGASDGSTLDKSPHTHTAPPSLPTMAEHPTHTPCPTTTTLAVPHSPAGIPCICARLHLCTLRMCAACRWWHHVLLHHQYYKSIKAPPLAEAGPYELHHTWA